MKEFIFDLQMFAGLTIVCELSDQSITLADEVTIIGTQFKNNKTITKFL